MRASVWHEPQGLEDYVPPLSKQKYRIYHCFRVGILDDGFPVCVLELASLFITRTAQGTDGVVKAVFRLRSAGSVRSLELASLTLHCCGPTSWWLLRPL